MFCTKCGLKNADDSLFCAGCGAKLTKPQYTHNVSENAEEKSMNSYGASVNNIVNAPTSDSSEGLRENVQQIITDSSDDTYGETINLEKKASASDYEQPQYDNQGSFQTQQFDNQENYEQQQFGNQENYGQQQFDNQENYGQQQFGNQEYYGQQQFGNQENYGQQQFDNQEYFEQQQFANQEYNNTVQKNKFSFKRFFFSLIIILASVASCAMIMLDYVGMKIGDEKTQKFKGYDVIKEGVEVDDMSAFDKKSMDDFEKSTDLFRTIVIVFEISLIVIAVIDLILLTAVRRKGAYVFTLIFSLLKMGLGGYAIYLWCFEVLDKFKNVLSNSDYTVGTETIKITSTIEMGVILAVGLQVLIFICSIILLTCKNRQKNVQ